MNNLPARPDEQLRLTKKEKEHIIQLAAQLPKKLSLSEKYDNNELKKMANPQTSFDDRYEASHKLVKYLENTLAQALEDPRRAKFLARHHHHPLEMLVSKVKGDKHLQSVALTLQEIYEQNPDKTGVLFIQKDNLSNILSEIVNEISPKTMAKTPSKKG